MTTSAKILAPLDRLRSLGGRLRFQKLAVGLILGCLFSGPFAFDVWAQPFPSRSQSASDFLFGSYDDPAEQSNISWWQSSNSITLNGGFSLIGPQWYTALGAELDTRRSETALHLSGLIRTGVYGAFTEDTNEVEDLIRLVDYARFRSRKGDNYLRVGPLNRTRLGTGHLVNFLTTDAARDSRTVGAEARARGGILSLEGFSESVLSVGLIGGRAAISPFTRFKSRISTLTLAASLVTDRSVLLESGHHLRGQEADLRIEAFRTGGFSFFPFVSVARIPEYGQGLLFGADLENQNFIDLARLHFRLALQYNSSDFRSGYFGSFYTVSSHRANILAGDGETSATLGLREIQRGNSIHSELRLLIFERFELWYAFMRYHGVQTLSEYHLRLFMHGRQFRIMIGQDRRGLVGFSSLFGALGSENRMRFEFDYRLFGAFWVNLDAHYTYSKLGEGEDGTTHFLVERRFNPMIGLKLSW
ncbi:MAG: hypothetical protein HN445_13050 [Bacteroidetes Order II. Incertae sedis bacterium]|nr:hypothetical protein [Bacteroidetes Order II. bacterium]MDG1753969.1 hypothetical protein [Rhodothermales bacterium]MDG2015864.1 hypothetical protein [Rhodothermales bacterium]HAY35881.1 hypothetical protein [Bacteroidota bacterium]